MTEERGMEMSCDRESGMEMSCDRGEKYGDVM